MTTGVKIIVKMTRAYIQDLRWRAIWLIEILGFQIDKLHEHLTTNVNENDFSICSKISYARLCRHGCYRHARTLA